MYIYYIYIKHQKSVVVIPIITIYVLENSLCIEYHKLMVIVSFILYYQTRGKVTDIIHIFILIYSLTYLLLESFTQKIVFYRSFYEHRFLISASVHWYHEWRCFSITQLMSIDILRLLEAFYKRKSCIFLSKLYQYFAASLTKKYIRLSGRVC